MIVGFLLNIPAYFLQTIIGLLPNGGAMPEEWVSAVFTIWDYIEAFSFIVPVGTLLSVLGLALAFHLAIFTFKVFHWIITKIPFVG